MLQQFIDEVDVGVGQLIALALVLADSSVGRLPAFSHHYQ